MSLSYCWIFFWYYIGWLSLNYFCTNGCKANIFFLFFFPFLLLSCGVISKLRNIDSGADQSKYSTLIDCMCHWGQVGHIMELACDWLSDVLTPRKVCIHQGILRIHKFAVHFCLFVLLLKKELLQCYVFLLWN